MLPGGQPYVQYTQLGQYGPAAVLNLATVPQQQQACLDASESADSYMRGRYPLPLLSAGADIVRHTAYVAWYLLINTIGYAPQAGSDANISGNYYLAMGYPDRPGSGFFPGIQAQRVHPDVTVSPPVGSDQGHDAPQVHSLPMRGWQQGNRVGGM